MSFPTLALSRSGSRVYLRHKATPRQIEFRQSLKILQDKKEKYDYNFFMYELLSGAEASILDKKLIEEYGLNESSLVENAAIFAFTSHKELFENRSVLFLVGKGNNGSDALALAKMCEKVSKRIYVYNLFDNVNEENRRRLDLLTSASYVSEVVEVDTIVDGIFGLRARATTDEKIEKIIEEVNSSKAITLSLDLPSLYRIEADYTVSFMTYKKEMFLPQNRGFCGKIELYNPGFPPKEIKGEGKSYLYDFSDYSVRDFSLTDYKNTRGDVTVIGGSTLYPGAVILASLASFSAGAGKVRVLSNKEVNNVILSSYPSIILSPTISDSSSSFVIGPGWGDEGKREIIESVIERKKPFVIDADGLKLIKGLKMGWRGVITPHLGEFKRILDLLEIESGDFYDALKRVSRLLEAIVVVKASTVTLTDGEKIYVVDGANSSLGTAGSGDVLAGIIGAFLSLRGKSIISDAINGVLLHQEAGREARKKYGYYSAEKIILEVGRKR